MFHQTSDQRGAGRNMADGVLDRNMKPTEEISVRDVFGIDTDMHVKAFADRSDRVPEIDSRHCVR